MPLRDFATAGLVVEVFSAVFDEVVLFVSDNAHVDPNGDRAVYRPDELIELVALGPDSLKRVHEIKRSTRGTVKAN